LKAALLGESSRVLSFARFLSDELALDVELVAVRCRNPITGNEASKANYRVLVEPDRLDFEGVLSRLNIDVLFASSFERNIAMRLGVPLFRLSYPVIDEVCLTNARSLGLEAR